MIDSTRYSAECRFALRVLSFYARLMPADAQGSTDPQLGGSLLYAGEPDDDGRALIVASNIAGAASLCATADEHAQKQAVHDGIVDCLVTSLDEALRIARQITDALEAAHEKGIRITAAGSCAWKGWTWFTVT